MTEQERKLSDEDMARVEAYLKTGYNVTDRKPFRPFRLALFLIGVVTCISVGSLLIARLNGIY
ncbi:MAG: DUF3094 family protein [Pseudomonadales bacterium]